MALLATSLGFAVVQLDVSAVNVAVQSIGSVLGGGIGALQWVVNSYTVAFAALILTAGALGDRLGAKRMFLTGFVVFTTASVGCGLALSVDWLVAARTVQGVGAAILVPCSLTLLNHAYPEPAARARAVGLWATGASVVLSAGPLLGGLLTATVGWRAIFFLNVPVGLLGVLLTARCTTETPRLRGVGLDLPGQVAAVAALGASAAATIAGGGAGFTAPPVLAGYAVAVLAGTAFLAIEARSSRAMLPLRLFRSPTFSAATGIGLLINIAFYGLIFVLALFFQCAQQRSALITGLALLPMSLAIIVGNLVAGRFAAAVGPRVAVAVGAGLSAAGCLALLGIDAGTAFPAFVGQLFVIGLGLGLLVPVMTSALLGSVDRSRSGIAAGTLNSARQTGSVLGVALFGALTAGPARLVSGLHLVLVIAAALALVAGACAVRLRPSSATAQG